MLILDRGVWIKFENDGKLEDGIIDRVFLSGCDKPVAYNVFCKYRMNEPIGIMADQIKFVKLNDLDGEPYYANYRILNEYTVPMSRKHINPGTVFRKEFYNKLCMCDATRGESYYIRHDENALKEAINKMWEPKNSYFTNRLLPKQVLLNGKYTTVVWKNGSHTVVKLADGEQYDPEKALLYAIVKHLCGDVKSKMDRYLEDFDKVTVYKNKSKKEFLKECDAIDAAGGLNQEYNPDEDETFFDDEEGGDDTE